MNMEQEAERISQNDGWDNISNEPWPVEPDEPTAYKEESEESWEYSVKRVFEY